jgi:betaine-aldehyde dehydrogenase
MQTVRPWVGGRASSDSGAEVSEIIDPARDHVIATVENATKGQVEGAVDSARRAFEAGPWPTRTAQARGDALLAIAARLRQHNEELAHLESLNVGKPIRQARNEVGRATAFFDYFGRMVVDVPGEVLQDAADQLTLVVRDPIGVVSTIVPWNFPLMIASSSIASALAAGNTVVVKPSPLTPLTILRLAELTEDILPPGVLNVVPGSAVVGEALVRHPDVARVFFTGSTETGAKIMAQAAAGMKRLGLELGGKAPTIVLDDAPLLPSVLSALYRLTLNQGQNCGAGSRLIVHESLFARFIDLIGAEASKLVLGDPQSDATDLGPLISKEHQYRVETYVEAARKEGERLYEGQIELQPPFSAGFFVPVSIWRCGPGTTIWGEEVFGPVLAVATFADDDQAIALANDSRYGLSAIVWAGDRGRALRIARALKVGAVRINNAGQPINAPWGGFKMSGIGRAYGRYGFEAETELKHISIDLG